jgi:pimeloyl-ACP methyl ester carboxylesterase
MYGREIPGPQGHLFIEEGGAMSDASPVLFVHCDCGTFAQWRGALTHVRATRRGIAFDLRGHGASAPAADGDYSFAGRSDDVGAVLDTLALPPVVLVGHSGGAITALHYAAQRPERIAGLFLVDPPGDARQFPEAQRDAMLDALRSPAWLQTTLDYYGSIAGPNEGVRAQVLGDAAATPQETVIGAFEALATYDPAPALQRYRGPRFSLVSEMGENLAALHRLDPTLRHEVVRGTGHWVHLDAPVMFLDRLAAFLRGETG